MQSRKDLTGSRPDAILVQTRSTQQHQKKLKLVVDAKYYSSKLSVETIEKTVDDVQLREDEQYMAKGLLVCSDAADVSEYNGQGGVGLVKLRKGKDEEFVRQIFYQDKGLF